MTCRRAFIAVLVCLATACSNDAPSPATAAATGAPAASRKYLLERVDDAAVVQIYADGFSALPLGDKILVWHLYQAALAGRDIYYDQRSPHGLEMRDVLEAIIGKSSAIDAPTLREVTRYTKLFWINSSPYNNLTARKFVLTCTPEAFADAAKKAAAAGATFPTRANETLDQLLARLQPMFFDPSVESIVTNKSPQAGEDMLLTSAANVYSGVSTKDVANFTEKYGLNSRLVKKDGKLVEEVYRVGGRCDAQIRAIVEHLEAAEQFASAPMQAALKALVKWYQTGDAADERAYDIAWVQDNAGQVDTINAFTEVYLDPRGVKGAWEAAVHMVNQAKTADIKKLASDAQWFEDHMPWDAKYRKTGVKGVTANAVDIVVETGEAGPVSAIGINLPNDQAVREEHGSKSVSLANIIDAYDKSADPNLRTEFAWTPEEAARSVKWGGLAADLLTNMHEVIGHASGKMRIKGKPEAALKQYYSALEEGRADLVGLYFIGDPKLAELGLVPAADQADIALAEYEAYAKNALVQLRRVRTGTQIEEDHMRNRQMVAQWLMANTKAIETRVRDGKTFYVVVDAKAFHDGVGTLLAEVQRIKSEGDFAAGKALFDKYGIHFESKVRDEVIARVDNLHLAAYTGFVQPRLTAATDPQGRITDVAISYPLDLTAQMLEYSALTKATRAEFLKK